MNVYFCCVVVTRIAFGMTNAVMRFSSAVTSYIGMQSCRKSMSAGTRGSTEGTYVRDPAKDVRMEAQVVLGHVQAALYEDLSLQCTAIVYE